MTTVDSLDYKTSRRICETSVVNADHLDIAARALVGIVEKLRSSLAKRAGHPTRAENIAMLTDTRKWLQDFSYLLKTHRKAFELLPNPYIQKALAKTLNTQIIEGLTHHFVHRGRQWGDDQAQSEYWGRLLALEQTTPQVLAKLVALGLRQLDIAVRVARGKGGAPAINLERRALLCQMAWFFEAYIGMKATSTVSGKFSAFCWEVCVALNIQTDKGFDKAVQEAIRWHRRFEPRKQK